MSLLTHLNARLSRWAMYLACVCLVGLLSVVVYGVVLRYGFNNAPAYVEQVALLLVDLGRHVRRFRGVCGTPGISA